MLFSFPHNRKTFRGVNELLATGILNVVTLEARRTQKDVCFHALTFVIDGKNGKLAVVKRLLAKTTTQKTTS
jgi:hypothetical protein